MFLSARSGGKKYQFSGICRWRALGNVGFHLESGADFRVCGTDLAANLGPRIALGMASFPAQLVNFPVARGRSGDQIADLCAEFVASWNAPADARMPKYWAG
jgi:hypothetical protein